MDFDKLIDEVALKFGYDEELVTALKRCIPAMADGKSIEDIELLKQTLKETEIIVFDRQPTEEEVDAIMNRKVNGRNDHVTFKTTVDRGEYGKTVAPASFRYQEIFDENMNIVDKAKFLYITRLNKFNKVHKTFGTMINLSHLIHEIGHAWASQKEWCTQREDGSYILRVGASENEYEVDRKNHIVIDKEQRGLYIEEAANTIEEEKALCKVLNIDSIKEIPDYFITSYQWKMTEVMRMFYETFGTEGVQRLRIQNDKSIIEELNELFKKTDHFERRKSDEYCNEKKEAVMSYKDESNMHVGAKLRLDSFFEKYANLFFGKNETPDFMNYFNGILQSFYNLTKVSYCYRDSENKRAFESLRKTIGILKRDAIEPIDEMKKIKELEQKDNQIKAKDAFKGAIKSDLSQEEINKIGNEINENNKSKLDEKDH